MQAHKSFCDVQLVSEENTTELEDSAMAEQTFHFLVPHSTALVPVQL